MHDRAQVWHGIWVNSNHTLIKTEFASFEF